MCGMPLRGVPLLLSHNEPGRCYIVFTTVAILSRKLFISRQLANAFNVISGELACIEDADGVPLFFISVM